MFDPDRFVAECRAALAEDPVRRRSLGEVVARAVSDPVALTRAFGEPRRAAVQRLYVGPDLTVLHFTWPPEIAFKPHDHRTWGLIGVYEGGEDNIFWRRLPAADGGPSRIEAASAKALRRGDVAFLGEDVVHSVINPLPRFACAIQIYGGDFYAIERSEWDPEALRERPYDMAEAQAQFRRANAALEVAS